MERKYCPSCGMDVDLERSLEGSYVMTSCALCGLGLGVKFASADDVRRMQRGEADAPAPRGGLARVGVVQKAQAIQPAVERPTPPDPRSASVELPGTAAAGASVEQSLERALDSAELPGASAEEMLERAARSGEMGGPVAQMERVYLVEDSAFLRQVTRDLLTDKGLAREIVECADGVEMVEAFARAAAAGQKPDLVILDVRMPELDGQQAAFALRAIETGLGVKRTPILFFSSLLCDEHFKGVLRTLGNARYIRKAEEGDVEKLGQRVVSVLERLVGARPS